MTDTLETVSLVWISTLRKRCGDSTDQTERVFLVAIESANDFGAGRLLGKVMLSHRSI